MILRSRSADRSKALATAVASVVSWAVASLSGRSARVLPLLVLGATTGCSTQPPDRVVVGEWGGDHAMLSVHDTNASVEFDCAHGSIDEALILDDDGRFDAPGRYVREHGGPAREGEPEDSQPARYTGSVDGRSMTLTVALEDGHAIGPFALALGQPSRLFKCL